MVVIGVRIGEARMKKMIALVAFVLISGASACSTFAEAPTPKRGSQIGIIDPAVEKQVQSLFDESGIPSLAAGIVIGEEIVWAKGYGEQPDLATVYMVGSIDKPFLATALLQLVEEGKLDLNDDVNDYLPFEVRHPDYPNEPITLQMLATHTSGMVHDVPGMRYVDNDGPMLRWRFWNLSRRPADLWNSLRSHSRKELIQRAFKPTNSSDGSDLWAHRPDHGYQYSNTGFYDLLGWAMEAADGQPYQAIIRNRVLDPLRMEDTAFEASAFPSGQLAIPYARFEDGYKELPITGTAASGRLRTTTLDLAQFLMLQMNKGSLSGVKILEPESVDLMQSRIIELGGTDFPSMELTGQGMGWSLWGDGLQGHSGAVPGFYAQMLCKEGSIRPFGVILMMNTGCSVVPCDFEWFDMYFVAIRELLLAEAAMRSAEDPATGSLP